MEGIHARLPDVMMLIHCEGTRGNMVAINAFEFSLAADTPQGFCVIHLKNGVHHQVKGTYADFEAKLMDLFSKFDPHQKA